MIEIAPLAVSAADIKFGTAPVEGTILGKAVRLSPSEPLVRYSLRAKDIVVLAEALGRKLPEKIGTSLDGIARLGPDEWHALLPAGTELPLVEGKPLAVIDVSARSVGIVVEGPGAAALIERGCPLDLAQFAPGRATRTVFETVEMHLWALAPERYHVDVWRSFAPWLWNSLAEAIV